MDFSLMTEPQLGGTYDQLLTLARWAEDRGLVSFARSDHYYSSSVPAPDATDAFATLAGLARDTESIRLCVLVSPVTFRHPAVIVKNALTIDQMSGGRFDLGLGTGWMGEEHDAFGFDLWPMAERFGTDPVTRWGFVIEPTDDGTTRLVQVTDDMRSDDLKALGAKYLPEIADRVQRNYETMEATLAAIARECVGD